MNDHSRYRAVERIEDLVIGRSLRYITNGGSRCGFLVRVRSGEGAQKKTILTLKSSTTRFWNVDWSRCVSVSQQMSNEEIVVDAVKTHLLDGDGCDDDNGGGEDVMSHVMTMSVPIDTPIST